MSQPTCHIPVMTAEIVEWLRPAPGKALVDGTLGGGGHTLALAERVLPGGRVIAVDLDATALERMRSRMGELPITLAQANFADLPDVIQEFKIAKVDGILLDLGLSSDQLAAADRGFSFQQGGELDLRFDTSCGEPAWQILARLDEHTLADLIYEYGEERFSRRIARCIVEYRRTSPLRTSEQLAAIVRACVRRSPGHQIDPATRTFQALRIAVNDELASLEYALERLPNLLVPGGRLAIISFHSLEDRRVKQAFREDTRLTVLTKKPIRPSESEVAANPRARSAKLRVAEKTPASES